MKLYLVQAIERNLIVASVPKVYASERDALDYLNDEWPNHTLALEMPNKKIFKHKDFHDSWNTYDVILFKVEA